MSSSIKNRPKLCFPLALMMTTIYTSQTSAMSLSLPLWKEDAELMGYKLPKAFGLSISNINMQQGIVVNSIELEGLTVPKLKMQADTGKQKSHSKTIRADVWLLPFLNVYGIAGSLEGYSETSVTVSLGRFPFKIPNFRLDLDGHTAGLGIVLAGGSGSWFTVIDVSSTETTLSTVDGSISSFVMSPRIGYDFTKHGYPLRVWGGAMYQAIEQVLAGSLAVLGLPPRSAALAPNGRFEVRQHLQSPWNPTAGFSVTFSESWQILGEFGFSGRKSAFISLERRW